MLAAATSLHATDYYVSPQGSDTNTGTIDAPFATLKQAISKAKAGTTIYLREGTYQPTGAEIMGYQESNLYACVYNLTASGITPTSAVLQWSSASGGPFHIFCDNILTDTITTSATSYTLTNLNASSRHTAMVYAEGMESNRCAQGKVQFRTLCGTGRLPLVEDFNDVTPNEMTPCWTRSVNFDNSFSLPRVIAFDDGEKAQMLSCGNNNTGSHFGMVIAPRIATDATEWHLQFQMMVSHPNTRVIIGFCDSTSDEQASYGFVPMETLTPGSNSWITYNKTYTLPSGACRLAFRMEQSMRAVKIKERRQ